MTLGKKIIELRKKYNLTQEKLALQIGISRQTLSNWESDITSPDIIQAKKIAQIFKISLDDLTDIKTEVECPNNKSILSNLIGKKCYIDTESDDYRLFYNTIYEVIDVNSDFIKVEFKHNKKTIIKLIDMNLVSSIKYIEKDGEDK